METDTGDDDPRSVELETLEAIFPEIQRLNTTPLNGKAGCFTFTLLLPVEPAQAVTVMFPATASQPGPVAVNRNAEPVDSLLISHLPPLAVTMTLPDGYPEHKAPAVTISTTPEWLPPKTLVSLQDDAVRLWEEAGRDLVAYTYIDHVQRASEDAFGSTGEAGALQIDPVHKLAVLDFDINAKKVAFERETFECGVCLDPKKGSKCHKMLDCGHIFCLQCLQDFYNDAIQEGNLSAVRCLTPNCAKDRASDAPTNKPQRAFFISPSELLQIGLSEEMVKRYVTLKYKTELEADKDTVYCPRQWCSGAARSKKRKKPQGLAFSETTSPEVPAEYYQPAAPGRVKFDKGDLLCVCEDCGFAFCSRCLQTWHGEFVSCVPKRGNGELTDEEKASLEYLKLHTSPCPTCAAPAQKTHGCNHMICSRCDTHFCYLCSSWLDPGNPYKHYNQQASGKVTSCYMRLWELEGGDGDDVGIGFVGGPGPPNVDIEVLEDGDIHEDAEVVAVVPEVEEADDIPNNAQRQRLGEVVAREAPLVLRLDNPPRPPQQQPQHGRGQARGGRGGGHAQRQQRQQQQQRQQEPARGAGRIRARGRRGEQVQIRAEGNNGAALDPEQEAWVRRFVQMALMDEEDQVGGDSDSDDGNWHIR